MLRRLLELAPLVAFALALACGPSAPPSGLTAPAVPTPRGDDLVIENRSSDTTLCYVYVAPVGVNAWGADRLAPSETIPPGARRGWEVAAGTWDIRVQDCSRNDLVLRREVPLGDGESVVISFTTPEPTAP